MNFPSDIMYHPEHTWARLEGDIVVVGISDYAQDQLGEVLYVEMPEVGDEVRQGEVFGSIESAKVVSDLYAPVSGEVVEINEALEDSPELTNESPYEDGWIIKVRIKDKEELNNLLDSEQYQESL